ncbi:GDP-Man:Man(3)GlcNAc(2)-PP-Dol alpha-1,2-mannosyltransferase isoform X2 [Drosophila montana]|uniref:GDP-Man:Man(3)GlcNAc(2)-PP-Dol alpha-1,2-mannosyltransferase isoform X2 n=1 Tax=Drosophila montana TaxID=40370 RepID=UPI00313D23DF
MVFVLIFWVLIWLLGIAATIFFCLRQWILRHKKKLHCPESENRLHVGIFHPYCNAGGGGERVLWCAVRALQTYKWVSCCSETILVNSTWTENHIVDLLNVPLKTHRVYPPCDIEHLKSLEHIENNEEILIVSVGQFRPEKNHPLQLQVLYELRTLLARDEALWNRIKLVIVGSCRHEDDYERLHNMEDLAKHLSLENSVEFKVNVKYDDLLNIYKRAKIGIHTMCDEHFGIGIVECMAAGIIMIAHRSGGPLLDIIETSEGSQNGYLATEAVEYAASVLNIILNSAETNKSIVYAARSSVERFSEKEFDDQFLRAISPLFV